MVFLTILIVILFVQQIYGDVLLLMYALLRETLNKYWKFKYNKIISVMVCREFFAGK